MKRVVPDGDGDRKTGKKPRAETQDCAGGGDPSDRTGFMNLDDNLLFEVFKHVDARTLAMAACVSKQWHKTAEDERLWELICTRHWANTGCGNQQLRSVVLALGGFRRLHSLFIWPLTKPQSSSSSSSTSSSASSSSSASWSPFPAMIGSKPPARWGKDEVHLSLSLLSIRYYEKMNFSNRGSR
ncbi:F-box protein GID2 [Benincasa hispida]|uniref:F-box protein GID2 n=1 Tax=Benincasa hispida TaxID=102211 RepID=UPI0018FFE174|nr:F-box protein GID2 [Benincasa hispida]